MFLTHPMELRKEMHGTGRLAHLSLPNSAILEGVDFSRAPRADALIEEPTHDCRLTYLGPSALTLSRDRYDPGLRTTPALLLIDATWPCARKILKPSANVRALPRAGFDPAHASELDIKYRPDPVCVSTIETVHRVLEHLGASGLETFGVGFRLAKRIGSVGTGQPPHSEAGFRVRPGGSPRASPPFPRPSA